jgi:hypothetical protein
MRFSKSGDSYRVTHIPGPAHNLLGLRFGGGEPGAPPQAIDLGKERAGVERLAAADVVKHVQEGIDEANAELKTAYRVLIVEFDSTDTPRYEIYRVMANLIVKRLASGVPFSSTPGP